MFNTPHLREPSNTHSDDDTLNKLDIRYLTFTPSAYRQAGSVDDRTPKDWALPACLPSRWYSTGPEATTKPLRIKARSNKGRA